MRIVATGLKALVAIALAGIAVSASAAPLRHHGMDRHAPHAYRVVHHRYVAHPIHHRHVVHHRGRGYAR